MVRPRTASLLVSIALALLLVGAVAPGVARPPPRPLCDGCGDSFAETATGHGANVTVERSRATVRVHENGSATWVVRNELADADDAATLRENRSRLTDIAERAMWDTDLLSASVDGDVVTARYRDSEFVEPAAGGTLRSGAFTEGYGYGNLAGLGADELTVVAPDGMRISLTVPGSTLSEDGRRMTLTRFDDSQEGHFVTLVPRDSALGPVLSVLAVGGKLAPVVLLNVGLYLLLPTVIFALAVQIVASGVTWLGTPDRFERVRGVGGAGLVVAGLLVVGLALLGAGGVDIFGGSAAPVFGMGVGIAAFGGALTRRRVRERMNYRTMLVAALGGIAVAVVATVGGALVFDQNGLTMSLLTALPFVVPVFALLPAGYALGRGNDRLATATAAVGFAVAMLPLTPLTTPGLGMQLLGLVLALMFCAVVTVVGVPLLVVGASLAAERVDAANASTAPTAD